MNEATKMVRRDEDPAEIDRRMDEPGPYRASAYGYGEAGLEGEVHLLDYWRAIRKRLWLVLGVAALITTLAPIFFSRKTGVYEAKDQVEICLQNKHMYVGKTHAMSFM